MKTPHKFSAATTKHLRHYVYALVDPRDKKSIFYVGKASANNRPFQHLVPQKGEEKKDKRIRSIRTSGLQPVVEILRYGLTSEQSIEVEASIIDAIGLENLTNKVRGHGVDRGRQTASEVESRYGSKPFAVEDFQEPCMGFFVNQTYSPTMSETEVYDCTRQFWYNVADITRTTKPLPYPVALAIVGSVVVRAYSVEEWFRAGTTLSTRTIQKSECKHRWEFVGQLIKKPDLVGRRLTKGGNDLPANELGYGYFGSERAAEACAKV